MTKAIFFDIDGTLLSHTTGRVSAEAAEAMASLRKKGILLLAATGRHILEFSDLPVNHLEFDGYVTLNGQLCLDKTEGFFMEILLRRRTLRVCFPCLKEEKCRL